MFKKSYFTELITLSLVVFVTGAMLPSVSNAKGPALGSGTSQDTTQLMELAFPASKSIDASDARLLYYDSARALDETPGGSQELSERVTPLGRIVQDPSHVALITARAPSNQKGDIQAAHPDQAVIGAYLFARRQKGWELETRADRVVSAGFFGRVDSVEVTRISVSTHVVSILSSSCWQGYCGTWLTVIGLGTNHVELWGDGIRLGANDVAAKEECADALRNAGSKILPSLPFPADKVSDQCFAITGRYAFPGISSKKISTSEDLILSFKGLVVPTNSGTAEQHASYAVSSEALYKLQNGHYRLFAGTNPVPGF